MYNEQKLSIVRVISKRHTSTNTVSCTYTEPSELEKLSRMCAIYLLNRNRERKKDI